MRSSYRIAQLFSFVILGFQGADVAARAAHVHDHGPRPIEYVENRGQWPARVLFKAGASGATVFVEEEMLTWVKIEEEAYDRVHDLAGRPHNGAGLSYRGHAWRMHFSGASGNAPVRAEGRSEHYYNFFLGDDPDSWAGNVAGFEELVYEDLWPGVDLRLHGTEGSFKYDVLLDPHADLSLVDFRFEGLDRIELDADGDLRFFTSVGELIESRPMAWYGDGQQERVNCEFRLSEDHVGFILDANVDRSRPIVIDPLLIASTLSGATGASNYGHCATFDNAGNIYTGARNFGTGYPVTVGAFQTTNGGGGTDISLSKYDPDGSTLLWASYLGGSSAENPHSLIVTNNGQLCVLGSTGSSNFPTTAGAYDNTFNGSTDITMTVFNAAGNALVGSTYLGGPDDDGVNAMWANYGEAYRGEIVLDNAGVMHVASFSSSTTFPTSTGAFQSVLGGGQDGVVFSMDVTCSNLLYSSFLGGSDDDNAMGIRIEPNGEILVTGATESANFPMVGGGLNPVFLGGARDGYVLRLTSDASALVNGTFYGTTDEDRPYFLDTDNQGDVWIYGQTEGNLPIAPAGTYGTAGGDIFIAKLDPTFSTLLVQSTIGSGGFSSSTAPVAFLIDVCDHIYISGYDSGSSLPLTSNSLYPNGSFYLAAFDVDMGGLLFGTYYGGSHVDGGTSRFDKNGIIYQGVCSGTGSLQTTPWAWSTNQTIGWDIGVFKIDFQVAGVNAAGAGTLNQGCAPIQIDFLNTSSGNQWIWDFGDGSAPDSTFQPSHTYSTPGTFTVTLVAFDSLSCNLADTITFPITIGQAQPLTAAFTLQPNSDCAVFEVSTTNSSTGAPLAFDWDMGDGTVYADTNVVHQYVSPGTYDVQLIAYDPTGCSQPDTVSQSVTILPPDSVEASFSIDQVPDCDEAIVSSVNTSSGIAPSFAWNMGDGTLLTGLDVTHVYPGPGQFLVTLIATDSSTCNIADTLAIPVVVEPVEPVVADFNVDQVFDCASLIVSTQNLSSGSAMAFQWDMGDGTVLVDTNVTHTYLTPGNYTISLIVSDVLGCSPNDTMTASISLDPLEPVLADMQVEQVGTCTQLLVEGLNLSTGDSVSYIWDMGDGTQYADTNVTHVYGQPGSYTITLQVIDLACAQSDQLSLVVELINDLPTPLVSDAVVCQGESIVLDATSDVDGYLWSTGESTPFIEVSAGGVYVVEVFTADCFGSDTVEVIAGQELDLAYSVDACPEWTVPLTIPLNGSSYQWATGGDQQTELVTGPGDYGFIVWDNIGCPHEDTITVVPLDEDARIFAPNAFTPDGDGVNDVFRISGYGEQEMELQIFNRWGELIYAGDSTQDPWDGTLNGEPVKQDVYVYRMEYNAFCEPNEVTTVFGHVSVLR
ncbi:MAG: PKD domain-containing protein [Flavobacteriales bacterium]|nr:PKD domain-containing protein [Flavobacteriales bacterium]